MAKITHTDKDFREMRERHVSLIIDVLAEQISYKIDLVKLHEEVMKAADPLKEITGILYDGLAYGNWPRR